MRHTQHVPGTWVIRESAVVSEIVQKTIRRTPLILVYGLVFLFLYLGVPLSSAQVSASLSGVITDQSGAAISGATVTATNLDTGISRTAPSGQTGRYEIYAL